jgi:hypothetical protein
MNDELQASLLSAIGIAAFERGGDGSFRSITPVPPWLQRLVSDSTFPFLGHVLTEADAFWATGTEPSSEWGPSAATDETGAEFHYKVIAVSLGPGRHYILFTLDRETDRIREILQTVRSQALASEPDPGGRAALAEVQREVRQIRMKIHERVLQLLGRATSTQLEALREISVCCDSLLDRVDALVRTSTAPADRR